MIVKRVHEMKTQKYLDLRFDNLRAVSSERVLRMRRFNLSTVQTGIAMFTGMEYLMNTHHNHIPRHMYDGKAALDTPSSHIHEE